MALIDKQKEVVNSWRVIFVVLLSITIGLVGFVFLNLTKLNELQLIFVNIGAVILIAALIFTAKQMITAIDKLKDL
jgi:flagellar biosynthesis protein FliQ